LIDDAIVVLRRRERNLECTNRAFVDLEGCRESRVDALLTFISILQFSAPQDSARAGRQGRNTA
jgi:hypothetical protein